MWSLLFLVEEAGVCSLWVLTGRSVRINWILQLLDFCFLRIAQHFCTALLGITLTSVLEPTLALPQTRVVKSQTFLLFVIPLVPTECLTQMFPKNVSSKLEIRDFKNILKTMNQFKLYDWKCTFG